MMEIHCHTNLDLFNESWPTNLPSIPRVGDSIDSKTIHKDFCLTLKVVAVRWKYSRNNSNSNSYYPVIELHDPHKRSIKEFYEWYAPLVNQRISKFI
jgi:hypothetical protein